MPSDVMRNVKTIVLVTANRLFRDGMALLLQRADRRIFGAFSTITDAQVALAGTPLPDLVVVQVTTPQDWSLINEVMLDRRTTAPTMRWLVLADRNQPGLLSGAIESGLCTALTADAPAQVLQMLTDLTLLGYSVIGAELAQAVLRPTAAASLTHARAQPAGDDDAGRGDSRPASSPAARAATARSSGLALSALEQAVLRGLIAGRTNKGIASDLNMGEATVKMHVKDLLRKMAVENRTQAAVFGLTWLARTPGRSGTTL